MTANAAILTTPRRIARWIDPVCKAAILAGCYARLSIKVPRANGKTDVATYYVEAIVDQVSGDVTEWKMSGLDDDGWRLEYRVRFGHDECGCAASKHGHGKTCKHVAGLRAALKRVGIEV